MCDHVNEIKKFHEKVKLFSSTLPARKLPLFMVSTNDPDKLIAHNVDKERSFCYATRVSDSVMEITDKTGTLGELYKRLKLGPGWYSIKSDRFNRILGIKDVIGFEAIKTAYGYDVYPWTIIKKMTPTQIREFVVVDENNNPDMEELFQKFKGEGIYRAPCVTFAEEEEIIYDTLTGIVHNLDSNFDPKQAKELEFNKLAIASSGVYYPIKTETIDELYGRPLNIPFKDGETAPSIVAFEKKTKKQGEFKLIAQATQVYFALMSEYEHPMVSVKQIQPGRLWFR